MFHLKFSFFVLTQDPTQRDENNYTLKWVTFRNLKSNFSLCLQRSIFPISKHHNLFFRSASKIGVELKVQMDIKINYNQHSAARERVSNCKKIHKQVSECKEGLPPTGSPQMGDPKCDQGVAVYIKTEPKPICLPTGVTNRDLPKKPIQKPARSQKPAYQSSHKVNVKFQHSENNENHSHVQNDFVNEFGSVKSCFSTGDLENTLLKLHQIIMILIPSISPISMIQEIIHLASKIMEIAKSGAVSKLSLNEKRHLANALQWNGYF